MRASAAVILVVLLPAGDLVAQADSLPRNPAPPDSSASGLGPFDSGVLRLGYGRFDNRGDPQLPDQTDPWALDLGVTLDLSGLPIFGVDLDLLVHSSSYPTDGGGSFIGTIDDETEITSWIIVPGLRLQLPPDLPIRGYGTVGVGFSQTTFRTSGTLLGLPTTAREETDGAVSLVLGAGAQAFLGNFEIHAEVRRVGFDGDFEDFDVRGVDLGGTMVLFGIGWSRRND